jgi:hypothetical protein
MKTTVVSMSAWRKRPRRSSSSVRGGNRFEPKKEVFPAALRTEKTVASKTVETPAFFHIKSISFSQQNLPSVERQQVFHEGAPKWSLCRNGARDVSALCRKEDSGRS